jgi:hypothetical protein
MDYNNESCRKKNSPSDLCARALTTFRIASFFVKAAVDVALRFRYPQSVSITPFDHARKAKGEDLSFFRGMIVCTLMTLLSSHKIPYLAFQGLALLRPQFVAILGMGRPSHIFFLELALSRKKANKGEQ